MSINIRDTAKQAYSKGVYAAHEPNIPKCPYSPIYDTVNYNSWYDGLASERTFMFSKLKEKVK